MAYLFDTDAISELFRKRKATALHHRLELVTGNVRHFRRVPGLVLQPALHGARGSGG